MNHALVYIASVMLMVWGVAHIIPARNIVKGFGDITADNKKILTMEIIAEGLTLIFLGALPFIVLAYPGWDLVPRLVIMSEAVMLVIMAGVTLFTGARTPVIWYKICVAVKTLAAALFALSIIIYNVTAVTI
jgi:hypothetical protein